MEKVKYLKELAYKHKEDLTIEVFTALLELEPAMFDEHYLLKDSL